MKTLKISLLFVLLASFFACSKDPDLTVVEETRFEGSVVRSITTDGDWEVEVVSSDNPRVELSYSKCLEKGVSPRLENGKLSLWLNYSGSFPSGATMKAVVYTDALDALTLDYYSTAIFKGSFTTQKLYILLTNSSTCSSLNADISTDCEVTLDKSSVLSDCNIVCAKARVAANNSSRIAGTIAPSDSLLVELGNSSRFVNYNAEPQAVKARLGISSLMNLTQSSTQNLHIELTSSEASVNVDGPITGSLKESSTLYYCGSADITGLNVEEGSEVVQL